jgi:hypothetical protein
MFIQGIISVEAFGVPEIYIAGPQTVAPNSIPSGESFGIPVGCVASQQDVSAVIGIVTGEAMGNPSACGNSKTATATTVWLSGGTAGTIYSITNTITTVGARTNRKTIKLRVSVF